MPPRKSPSKPIPSPTTPNTITKIGRVSTESVYKHTRKHWDQWIPLLDRAGARKWTHQKIVSHLALKHELTPWWQQVVTTSYEIHTGRRKEGQNQKGEYSVTVTKSLSQSARSIWKLLNSVEGLKIWLSPTETGFNPVKDAVFERSDGFYGQIRTIKAGERFRLSWLHESWPKPTIVQIVALPRTGSKSLLIITHEGFSDTDTREKMRQHWKGIAFQLAGR